MSASEPFLLIGPRRCRRQDLASLGASAAGHSPHPRFPLVPAPGWATRIQEPTFQVAVARRSLLQSAMSLTEQSSPRFRCCQGCISHFHAALFGDLITDTCMPPRFPTCKTLDAGSRCDQRPAEPLNEMNDPGRFLGWLQMGGTWDCPLEAGVSVLLSHWMSAAKPPGPATRWSWTAWPGI